MGTIRQLIQDFLTPVRAFLRSHRYSLAISLTVTLLGLLTYVLITWTRGGQAALVFLDNVELRTLDARFQMRGP
ncbi:MAG TPA: hypothetical protein VJ417_00630, partial [Candidatus Glassbacteria bacterium]|nr:hypothetical protein [Candidatus Glassbacteria bacterium]